MKLFFIANLIETLSVYVIKRDFVIIRDLYREMKIFPGKLRYNQRFAIAGYVINREYCTAKGVGGNGHSGEAVASVAAQPRADDCRLPFQ
jgi:hypothetical protein